MRTILHALLVLPLLTVGSRTSMAQDSAKTYKHVADFQLGVVEDSARETTMQDKTLGGSSGGGPGTGGQSVHRIKTEAAISAMRRKRIRRKWTRQSLERLLNRRFAA